MDREVTLTEWQQAWVERTEPNLRWTGLLTIGLLSAATFYLALQTSLRLRRCYLAMKEDPTSRAAIYAECNKKTRETLRKHFYISLLYMVGAIVIWISDAAIGVLAIWNDATKAPEVYDANVWLGLAISAVGMLAIFVAIFIIFPLLQMMLFSRRFCKSRRDGDSTSTMSALIPEARLLATYLMHMWSMLGFLLITFWPVFTQVGPRLFIAEACFGSAMMWGHTSFLLNWRIEESTDVEGPNVAFPYGTRALTACIGASTQRGLPRMEDEKQALLSSMKN